MATQITNYQCPGCTGPLHFSAATGNLECEYCGSSYTVTDIEAHYARKNLQAAAAAEAAQGERQWDAESMRAYSCPSCGAELLCDVTTAATACPYCGNPTVVPGQFFGVRRPDFVIPFAVEKSGAVEALKKHYQGKPLLPGGFASENHLEEVKGIYVPFWLYDAQTKADVVFHAAQVSVRETPEERVIKKAHYRVERSGGVSFEKIPVDASSKMPDGHMDSIEPYDYDRMEPFSMAYLPGFLADKYDEDSDSCSARAKERCRNSSISELQSTVTGFDECHVESADVQVNLSEAYYAMLPVWLLSTKWKDKNYLFAVNGQTGKIVGNMPVSVMKLILWFAGIWAIFAGIGYAMEEMQVFLMVGAFLAAVVCLLMAAPMRSAKAQTHASGYIPSSGVTVTHALQRYTHTTVTRQRISKNSKD